MAVVLAWLSVNQPQLEIAVERDWIWIKTSLKGDEHEATRTAIKTMLEGNGFAFAKKGHTLPDGSVAYWSHPCAKPTPFKGKWKGGGKHKPETETKESPDQGVTYNPTDWESLRRQALAFLN